MQVRDLRLSLLSGALSVDNLSVSDDPRFNSGPFLAAKELNVGVELTPLIFSRQLNVKEISVVDPQLVLLKDPSGKGQ